MGGKKQLAIGLVCGAALSITAGALLGSGSPSSAPVIVGVTGFTTQQGINGAIAWEQVDGELRPVAKGLDLTSPEALFSYVTMNLDAIDPQVRQPFIDALQAAGNLKPGPKQTAQYQKAAEILAAQCPACQEEFKKCIGSPTQCIGRLVACMKTNCH